MIHTFNCVRCNGEYETACFTFMMKDGVMVNAYEVESYRRQQASYLCSSCFVKMGNNPAFEAFFALKESQRARDKVIEESKKVLDGETQEAEKRYQASLEKTPERIEALKNPPKFDWAAYKPKFGFGFVKEEEK